jgi:hypothetical protein
MVCKDTALDSVETMRALVKHNIISVHFIVQKFAIVCYRYIYILIDIHVITILLLFSTLY